MSEYKDIENKMARAISALKEEFAGIRAGRPIRHFGQK